MINEVNISDESNRVKTVEPSLIRTVLNRVDELRKEGHEIIALSAGEPDFNTPADIKDKTIKAIQDNYTHYSSNRGIEMLRMKIAEKTQRETGVTFDYKSQILVTNSAAEAINNVILSLLDEGEEAIIFSPAFVNYENMVKISGGISVVITLKEENQFQIDVEDVKKHISANTKMLIINNPNNPTGAVYDNKTLEKLCKLAVLHNFLIVSDEMYSGLVYEGASFQSIASFPEMKERSIIINGFSKTYAMTGWRLGYIMACESYINAILKIHQYSTTCSPTFIQIGTAQGMDTSKTFREIEEMKKIFSMRREQIMRGLDKIKGISYIMPQGAFYIMVDVSGTGLTGEEYAKKLLEEMMVAVIPGIGLGKHCIHYIRISFAASTHDIEEALKRMDTFTQRILNTEKLD